MSKRPKLTVAPHPQHSGGINISEPQSAIRNPQSAIIDADAIESFIALVHDLRRIRDHNLYLPAGYHSFREWTMAKFGEKLGAVIDESL